MQVRRDEDFEENARVHEGRVTAAIMKREQTEEGEDRETGLVRSFV